MERENFVSYLPVSFIIIIIMFYYAIKAARQNNTVEYTRTNASTKKAKKQKRNKTKNTLDVTLLCW